MAGSRLKFGIGIGIILVAVGWLGFTGFQESKSYYVTLDELFRLADNAYDVRLRVAGEVEKGSVISSEQGIVFSLRQNEKRLTVRYVGIDPLPDTFKEGVQAVVEGVYEKNGEFKADFIQSKCASKYEAAY